MSRRIAAVTAIAALCMMGVGAARQRSRGPALDAVALAAELQATTAKWNAGDLDGFIAPYAHDSTFMTADGPVDWAAMRARYQSKYFGGGMKPRPLRFERIVVRALGDDHALMTGRYVLGGDGQPDQTGWFTLVWARTADGWRIEHDHSS